MLKELRAVVGLFVLLFLLTGLGYPMAMLGIGQALFPHQANGSLIEDKGAVVGSELIGQNFSGAGYVHPRPSSAGDKGYDASNSSGSNAALTSSDFIKAVSDRVAELKKDAEGMVPVDLVTASASGLDPDISPDAANLQAARVAESRHLDVAAVKKLIAQNTTPRTFGVLGENRVNVLDLNRALDRLAPPAQ